MTQLSCGFLCRGRAGLLFSALMMALASGCPAPAVVPPDPAPSRPVAPPPPPPPPPPAPVQNSGPPPIIIHQADLHGQVESKQGSTITIRALLMMTKTQPAVGNKGVLFFAPADPKEDSDWVQLGEVEIKRPLDSNSRIQIKILEDEKKFMIPGGKHPTPLPKNTRVRLRWQWQ